MCSQAALRLSIREERETSAAYYQVIEQEAEVVRQVYQWYTQKKLSINAIVVYQEGLLQLEELRGQNT
ncbi:hypothetical protein MYX84_06810 [Acidobacteria bacterium AH-259-O06]|nr:hypothetical protein [Acidobacteria bacterium AH-259-O06]